MELKPRKKYTKEFQVQALELAKELGIGQIKAISLPSAEYRRANFGAGWRAKRSACQEDSSKSQAKNVQVSSARMA